MWILKDLEHLIQRPHHKGRGQIKNDCSPWFRWQPTWHFEQNKNDVVWTCDKIIRPGKKYPVRHIAEKIQGQTDRRGNITFRNRQDCLLLNHNANHDWDRWWVIVKDSSLVPLQSPPLPFVTRLLMMMMMITTTT